MPPTDILDGARLPSTEILDGARGPIAEIPGRTRKKEPSTDILDGARVLSNVIARGPSTLGQGRSAVNPHR